MGQVVETLKALEFVSLRDCLLKSSGADLIADALQDHANLQAPLHQPPLPGVS